MRFIIRQGVDPVARADATLLKALGLPYGGVLRVGKTHVLVKSGETKGSTALHLGPQGMKNANVTDGQSVDATRAVLSHAALVRLSVDQPVDPEVLQRAWQGRPLSDGDRVSIPAAQTGTTETVEAGIVRVEPGNAGLVGPGTRFMFGDDEEPNSVVQPTDTRVEPKTPAPPPGPTRSEALLAGLNDQKDLLAGWLALLTSASDLPAAWGLPRVAGVLLEGPQGCGKSELVAAAASEAGASVHEVSLDQVFKPEKLLDVLEAAIRGTVAPAVIFVDRLEVVSGDEGMAPFRTQMAAVLRWFLDSLTTKPGRACVIGCSSRAALDPAIASSPLLPRSLTIPPPDLNRRRLLFEAALARVPTADVDYAMLAGRSAGFSGTDVVAAVIQASTRLARTPGAELTTDDLVEAIRDTTPSLGSLSLGEMPNYGFDQVANLDEVKQRLVEAVVWPITDPDRFKSMGIDPPRGILLYGPPGTGKTFVVRALAHEAGSAFFPVKGAELLDKYVGESERAVRELFGRARAAAPAIIFFDEIDALAPVRGRSTTTVTDSVVAALLTEMDGITERGNVAVIGATNRADLIDPALLRAGRFETQIEIGLPDAAARRALIDLSDVPFAEDIDKAKLAEITEGMSMADLAGVLRESALAALRADAKARQVEWIHLISAIKRWQSSQAASS
ncbi:MAG: AAA family ATPase [Acidimicrobiia bacterium]